MAIKTIVISKDKFTCEQDIDDKTLELSKANPSKYVIVSSFFTKIEFHIHDRKPQSLNSPGAEITYRYDGGFWKNGKIIKPSPSFIKKFNRCPVSR